MLINDIEVEETQQMTWFRVRYSIVVIIVTTIILRSSSQPARWSLAKPSRFVPCEEA